MAVGRSTGSHAFVIGYRESMDVTIVADDLTGACDTGALFAGRGSVSVVIAPALPDTNLEVIALDIETRARSDADAAAAVKLAVVGSTKTPDRLRRWEVVRWFSAA